MYPSAIQGHMPFVDNYRKEQIQKVLEKNRSRHSSGPDRKTSGDKSAKYKDTHSMPILWQSAYTGQRRKFISMPALDDSYIGVNTHKHNLSQRLPDNSKHGGKGSLLNSLKKIFSKKEQNTRSSSSSSRSGTSGAIVRGNHSRAYISKSSYKKPADSDIVSGVRSPKRQRMRTVSNISGVMETIQEVNEILVSTDHISDPEDSSNSSSEETLNSIASAAELCSANVFYSCGNLSNWSDSSSSHHSSAEIYAI